MSLNETYMNEIAFALTEKKAAVMIGAGFSKNAMKVNKSDAFFMNWNELTDLFYKELYGDSETPGKNYNSSLRLAQEFEVTLGRPALEAIIHRAVPDEDYAPSELYKSLLELGWNDVFTTNYDTLLERATEMVTTHRYDLVLTQEDLVYSNGTPRIVKLHGSFPSSRPFIITEEDYRVYPRRAAAFVNTVQQSLIENVFCMIGFSCEDPNFLSWIGWIHDNIGYSQAHKIYMISVTHVAEPKKKICFSRNITIIDLEELWPEKTIGERLADFLSFLKDKEDACKNHNEWFGLNDIFSEGCESVERTTQRMSELRKNYPGWVYLPYDLRNKTNLLLSHIGFDEQKLRKAGTQTALDFIYEYVLMYSLAGCPLDEEDVTLFGNLINEWNSVNDRRKLTTIYVHLVRAFREQSKWNEFDKYIDILQREKLAYDEEQLLNSEKCRRYQQQFNVEKLLKELHSWSMSDNDLYWPIIKSGMLAQCGEFQAAESILISNLSKVRRQLSKRKDDLYLSSIEECTVHLLNHIRQADGSIGTKEIESDKLLNESGLSWWNDYEKYSLRVLSCKPMPDYQEYSLGYRLNAMVTTHYSMRNPAIQLSLEYWRFREVSGSPFRIGIVVNKAALKESIQWLEPYYAQWAIYLLISSGQRDYMDCPYGRVKISEKRVQDVDDEIASYIQILRSMLKGDVLNENSTFFINVVNIVPEIIGRLSYRCSIDKKDELLDTIYELITGKYKHNCRNLDILVESVMMSYTLEQQIERLEKLLKFPYRYDVVSKYRDPLHYITYTGKKIELKTDVYDAALSGVRNGLENHERNVREDALNRLLYINSIVRLKRGDRKLLIDALNEMNNTRSSLILYQIDKSNSSEYLKRIVNDTYNELVNDAKNTRRLAFRAPHYMDLFPVLSEVDFNLYNPAEWIQSIISLINVVSDNPYTDENEILETIKNATRIAIGVLVSLAHSEKNAETESQIKELIKCLDEYYDSPIWMDLLKCVLSTKETYDKFAIRHKIICCSNTNMELYGFTLDLLNKSMNKKLLSGETKKIMSAATEHIMDVLLLKENECYAFINALDTSVEMIKLQVGTRISLDYLLKRAIEVTTIGTDDSEQMARSKVISRRLYAVLASTCKKHKIKLDSIVEWKRICEDPDEFLEVRKVNWD